MSRNLPKENIGPDVQLEYFISSSTSLISDLCLFSASNPHSVCFWFSLTKSLIGIQN